MAIFVSALSQGLLWAILGIGIHITYRILGISDLTSEGSFTLGAAVGASLIVNGVNPWLAGLLAVGSGALAGFVTGILNTRFGIPSLLAGILSMTGLYSINLRIMGKANIALTNETTVLTSLKNLFGLAKDRDAAILLGVIVCTIVIAALVWFFNTEFGYTIVATGNNDKMIEANGVSSKLTKVVGLMIANGLIALSGCLVSQYNGYADVTMGVGAIVIGLASVIIGEVVLKKHNLFVSLLGVCLGSIIYRLIVSIVINTSIIGANDIKLITAIVVAIAISVTTLKKGKSVE